MPRYDFDKVAVKAKVTWRDENGKKRQQTKEFSQTLNWFNRNKHGQLKTEKEIMLEIVAEADAWIASHEHASR